MSCRRVLVRAGGAGIAAEAAVDGVVGRCHFVLELDLQKAFNKMFEKALSLQLIAKTIPAVRAWLKAYPEPWVTASESSESPCHARLGSDARVPYAPNQSFNVRLGLIWPKGLLVL